MISWAITGHLLVAVELHRVRCTSLSARTQVCTVTEHFGKRHLGPDVLGVAVGFHALDPASTAGQVAHHVAHVVLRGHDLDGHDRLEQDRIGHLSGLAERHLAGDLERHFAGVDVVVLTVHQADLHVHRGVSRQNAVVEGRLDALVRRLDVFAGNASTGDLVLEDVAVAHAARLHRDLDDGELTRTTRLLDVAVFDAFDLLRHRLAIRHLGLADGGIDAEFALHAVDEDLEVQLAHSRDHGLAGLFVGADAEGRVLVRQ